MNIEIDGYNVKYAITGSGQETVVMLQGWGTDFGIYDSIAKTINSSYQFIQFNFPGFGGAEEPREAWNVDAFADFFCKLMEALQIKKAILIGHSYGGRVIIKLANRKNLPFEISRIVLIDSAGIMAKHDLKYRYKIAKYKFLKKLTTNKVIYYLFPELIDDWKSRQGSQDYREASEIMKKCLVMAVNEDLTSLLPNITQETLLIWGDKDTATPLADGKKMEALIPNAGLTVLEGSGHFSYLEKPIEFNAIMKNFFRIGEQQ